MIRDGRMFSLTGQPSTFGGSGGGGGGGILDYLRSRSGGPWPVPFGRKPAGQPPGPTAVASPEGGGVVTPGPTKTDMGRTPGPSPEVINVPLPPTSTPSTPPPNFDPYKFAQSVSPALREQEREPTSHIRYSVPGMTEMRDYDPDEGIAAFAGKGGLGTGDMRIEGRPGGGAFTPSPTPVIGRTPGPQGVPIFDWKGVANPMAFEAYHDPVQATAIEAARVVAERSAADPLWDEREKAKIWMDTQIGVQKGIQGLLMENYMTELEKIKKEIDREFPGISPQEKDRIFRERSQNLETAYSNVFGNRGASSSLRSYGDFPG